MRKASCAAVMKAIPDSSNVLANNLTETDAREFFASCRPLVDSQLDRLLPREDHEPLKLHRAIRWSVFAGGKRFRPALLLATGQTFGAKLDDLIRTACALEMIHTYSLIHDDLPSMDDDDLRRGRPTCHIKFDEATAILAGDALQALAFQTIAEDRNLPAEIRARLIAELAGAAGTPAGMVSGQARDLDGESRDVDSEELERIHHEKTGALICAAGRCGAIIAGATEAELLTITNYTINLGLLFQITDDLLDVTATAVDLGKTPGKDARSRKATFPAIYGVEVTRQTTAAVHRKTCDALDQIEKPTALLRSIADFIMQREA